MELATVMAGWAIALTVLWAISGLLSRLIDRSIDRNLPDPRWFEA